MSKGVTGTVSVLLSSTGSALRAKVAAAEVVEVERVLAVVRDNAGTALDPLRAVSAARPAGQGAEGEINVETSAPVGRRGLKRLAVQTGRGMRRLGYRLDRELVADGGQVISVYTRHLRVRS